MKNLVRKGFPGSSSVVPSPSVPAGNSGKTKNVVSASKTNRSSVVRTPRPASSNKRGGPAQKAPSGKGVVASGGGSFGQN